jgi:hypothetical protein
LSRLLIVDASLSKTLARELESRGRPAVDTATLGLDRLLDDPFLLSLAERDDEWVLVAADDKMPLEHAETVRETSATIATVDGLWRAFSQRHGLSRTQEQFKRDSIHRWAHVIAEQRPGEVRRYTPSSHSIWRPRKRA